LSHAWESGGPAAAPGFPTGIRTGSEAGFHGSVTGLREGAIAKKADNPISLLCFRFLSQALGQGGKTRLHWV